MRLDRLWVDGLRNLRDLTIDFDERRLTTVVIGQNGAGKSNLIEAIATIFRDFDLGETPRFQCELDYRIGNHRVQLVKRAAAWTITVDGTAMARAEFDRRKADLFPDQVFGYYSGASRRFEALFDKHQERYYRSIIREDAAKADAPSIQERRLFYCRQIHGVLALLSFFAFPDDEVKAQLSDMLGITGFHSALIVFREPWFAKSRRGRKSPQDFWGAKGRPGESARRLRNVAFYPLSRNERIVDDYRDRGTDEQQHCVFLRDGKALSEFASAFDNELDMFEALESIDISDLIRSVDVWVTRRDDTTGEVSFGDLSDGERQLLMVLGLIRLSRGKRALFLLDEPDTHLNPAWQHRYLDLVRDWARADPDRCQLILTSHSPLTIAALEKAEVRVMHSNAKGDVTAKAPYVDPRGMGFTATLTEIFGLSTTLDAETQRKVDRRNELAASTHRTDEQDLELLSINDELNRLGFLFEDREPLYQDFLHAWRDLLYADRPPLGPEELQARHAAMTHLLRSLRQVDSAS
jgi:predicted ATPase